MRRYRRASWNRDAPGQAALGAITRKTKDEDDGAKEVTTEGRLKASARNSRGTILVKSTYRTVQRSLSTPCRRTISS
jgi:hypothetical protein